MTVIDTARSAGVSEIGLDTKVKANAPAAP